MDNFAILTAILVVLISIGALLLLLFRKKGRRDGVLLVGLSDSGKTLIFSRLVHNKHVDTVTSLMENISPYTAGKLSVQLIDVPGQERVRARILDKVKPCARAVVFTVDSATVHHQVRDVAEFLHDVLADAVLGASRPPLLVLCNKQDAALAKSPTSIRALLEKELNIVRTTKASSRRLATDVNTPAVAVGDPSKPFQFDQLPISVTFAESSAVVADEDSPPQLEQLQQWIKSLK